MKWFHEIRQKHADCLLSRGWTRWTPAVHLVLWLLKEQRKINLAGRPVQVASPQLCVCMCVCALHSWDYLILPTRHIVFFITYIRCDGGSISHILSAYWCPVWIHRDRILSTVLCTAGRTFRSTLVTDLKLHLLCTHAWSLSINMFDRNVCQHTFLSSFYLEEDDVMFEPHILRRTVI